ncbi:MAG: carboxypeptidase regulatory-like domain-containing protein, partial [Saprospiraceae bacterium]|nr:carboxypeptidase regulatory-like domain-containing protein [Saprospiraceae bacterium]
MKYLFFLLLSPIFVTLQPYTANTALSGKITDERGEALIGAAVKVTKDASLVKGAVTDYNGQYRLEIDPGVYTVEISYTGYESRRITDVVVTEGKITTLDATLKTSGTLSEVVVISYKVPLIEQDK